MASNISRVGMILNSKVDDLLKKFEDPERMVDAAIEEEIKAYTKLRKESLPVLANQEKLGEDIKKAQAKANKWHNIALQAVKSGNDNDARMALAQENTAKAELQGLTVSYEAARQSSDALRKKLKEYEQNIQEMKQKAAQIKATAVTAKATKSAADIASKYSSSGGRDTFRRMEEKANQQLAEARALEGLNDAEIDTDARDLEKKYMNGNDVLVDDQLAAMKASLGMASYGDIDLSALRAEAEVDPAYIDTDGDGIPDSPAGSPINVNVNVKV